MRNLCGNYNFDNRNEQVFTCGMCHFASIKIQRPRLTGGLRGVVRGKGFTAASLASAVKEKASPEGEAVKADSRESV